MGRRVSGGPCDGKDVDGGGWLGIGLVDGMEDSADGGAGGEDIVDYEPVDGGIREEGGVGGVNAI